jgi:hypothetical protein
MVLLKWTLPAAGFIAAALALQPALANEPPRDLTSMCGANMDVTAQRMQAGALNGMQATECWCFFWEKAGSKPIRMFNGKQAADVCARYIAPRT